MASRTAAQSQRCAELRAGRGGRTSGRVVVRLGMKVVHQEYGKWTFQAGPLPHTLRKDTKDHRGGCMHRSERRLAAVICALLAAVVAVRAQNQPSPAAAAGTNSRVVTTRALPVLDGAHLEATIVEVTYAPGASSTAHSHPCTVIGYVVSGAVRMQVRGEAEAIYKAGDSFYEAPNGVHQVSANASETEPAKFIAAFTCDRKTPLLVPPASGQ
jgi:quercetin dioxygenase-like cupin family protein